MRAIERRIGRLENERRDRAPAGPTIAEIIRERRRKRLAAEGKEPKPERPPRRWVDSRGRPLRIGEIIRQMRWGHT